MGAALLAFSAGCFPEVDPPWVVGQPRLAGTRTRVVAVGPHGRPLSDDPPDRVRAEYLPGDTIRLEALVVGPDGIVDPRDDGIWLLCGRSDIGCNDVLGEGDVPHCDGFEPLPEHTCRLGRNDAQPWTVADVDDFGWHAMIGTIHIPVAYVGATEPDVDSEDCLRRFAQRRRTGEEVWDCVFGSRWTTPGPKWTLDAVLWEVGGFVDPPPEEVPDEVAAQDPDLRPEPELAVFVADDPVGVAPGSTLELEVGQQVYLFPQLQQRDIQDYWRANGNGEFVPYSEEQMVWTVHASRSLDGAVTDFVGRLQWTVAAEDDGGTIVITGDNLGSRNEAWAWLHLRVRSP